MRVILSGGGTSGHVNPAIEIAKYIRKNNEDAKILFIGTKNGMEGKLVSKEGFDIEYICVKGFKRKVSLELFKTVWTLFKGIRQSKRLIRDFKPDIVIGTGGYVCGPVLFCASRLKIPTLIHESNAFPGITNKILARFVNTVAVSFDESAPFFKSAKKVVLTGNPVKNEMLDIKKETARKSISIGKDKKLIVIVGGSRGAEKINDAVTEMILKKLKDKSYDVIFSTGEKHFDEVSKKLSNCGENIKVKPYIYDSTNTYASADVMICRAGAITMSEITVLGIPAIIIPSPYVTANHQEYNARALEKNGAAIVILEKDLDAENLFNTIDLLLSDQEGLKSMSENSKKMGIRDATQKIYSLIEELTQKAEEG